MIVKKGLSDTHIMFQLLHFSALGLIVGQIVFFISHGHGSHGMAHGPDSDSLHEFLSLDQVPCQTVQSNRDCDFDCSVGWRTFDLLRDSHPKWKWLRLLGHDKKGGSIPGC